MIISSLFSLSQTNGPGSVTLNHNFIIKNCLQYCEKIIRANFDEFRLLFSRTFDEISVIFHANFRTVLVIIRRNFARSLENSQSETKYRTSEISISRNFEEISLKRNEISANFRAEKARLCTNGMEFRSDKWNGLESFEISSIFTNVKRFVNRNL